MHQLNTLSESRILDLHPEARQWASQAFSYERLSSGITSANHLTRRYLELGDNDHKL